jgi:dCMP deaminase
MSWDKKWIEKAQQFAEWSKDRSRKVGAVIVDSDNQLITQGYNGFPRGVNDDIDCRHERPSKYDYTEHAERNALYNAARIGVSVKGCTIYTQLFPCVDCARGIIQTGLSRVVTYAPDHKHHKYGESWKVSLDMLKESGVEVTILDP